MGEGEDQGGGGCLGFHSGGGGGPWSPCCPPDREGVTVGPHVLRRLSSGGPVRLPGKAEDALSCVEDTDPAVTRAMLGNRGTRNEGLTVQTQKAASAAEQGVPGAGGRPVRRGPGSAVKGAPGGPSAHSLKADPAARAQQVLAAPLLPPHPAQMSLLCFETLDGFLLLTGTQPRASPGPAGLASAWPGRPATSERVLPCALSPTHGHPPGSPPDLPGRPCCTSHCPSSHTHRTVGVSPQTAPGQECPAVC